MEETQAILSISHGWVRLLCGILCVAIGIGFFVNPMFLGIRHAGCYVGTLVCALASVFFFLNQPISQGLGKIWANQHGRILLCVVAGFLAVCVLFAAVISICMTKSALAAPKEEATVVVLGCKVRGTSPSLMLKRRLDAALGYLDKHPDVDVIVCGGQGKDEEISEAQCMAEYLESKGISASRIRREDKSVNTRENLSNAKDIIAGGQEEFNPHIVIVTDGFHELRASLLAKDCGLRAKSVPARTAWYLAPSYWVREWMALAAFFVFG